MSGQGLREGTTAMSQSSEHPRVVDRDALDRLFHRHHRQYPTREQWEAAIKEDLLRWSQGIVLTRAEIHAALDRVAWGRREVMIDEQTTAIHALLSPSTPT